VAGRPIEGATDVATIAMATTVLRQLWSSVYLVMMFLRCVSVKQKP